jgi:hypothetical protein
MDFHYYESIPPEADINNHEIKYWLIHIISNIRSFACIVRRQMAHLVIYMKDVAKGDDIS